jgi:pyruvate kinase
MPTQSMRQRCAPRHPQSRSTKVVCTMGPSCWSEETMGKLLDAGMDVIRLNFSHGDHKGHLEVLERFRKVKKTRRRRG